MNEFVSITELIKTKASFVLGASQVNQQHIQVVGLLIPAIFLVSKMFFFFFFFCRVTSNSSTCSYISIEVSSTVFAPMNIDDLHSNQNKYLKRSHKTLSYKMMTL